MKTSILSFLFLSFFVFSSCQKGDEIKDDEFKGSKDWDGKDKDDDEKGNKCFDLVYPVTYNMPDGSTATGDNEDDVWTAIKAWYEDHPDSAGKPTLQYPVDILWEDGTNETITDEGAMILAKKDCDDEKDEDYICEWDGSKVADTDIWEEYIVEELVTSEDCDCIVGGIVKYTKADSDFAFVIYYGKGECDGWAHLVTYYEGEDKKPKKCKFKTACNDGE